jgi:hypothetical protein
MVESEGFEPSRTGYETLQLPSLLPGFFDDI